MSSPPFAFNPPPPARTDDDDAPFAFSPPSTADNNTFAFGYEPPPTSAGYPPMTSGGRPVTAAGIRPGTSRNPFKTDAAGSSALPATAVSANPPPSYDSRGENPWSSYGGGAGRNAFGAAGYSAYDEAGRPPPSSYGTRPPGSSWGPPNPSRQGYGGGFPDDDLEEEDSDDENVFAFLPPTTADIEQEKRRAEEEKERARVAQAQAQAQVRNDEREVAATQHHLGLLGAAGLHSTAGMRPLTEHGDESRRAREEYAFAYGVDAGTARKASLPQQAESPPSTGTDSNQVSRAGPTPGEFKMTRMDGAARGRGLGGQEGERDGKEDAESVTVAASLELSSPTKEEPDTQPVASASNAAPPRTSDADIAAQYGKHWTHFQPNPSRYNSNSGPYKRHREYHYNLAYPEYAMARGKSAGGSSTDHHHRPDVVEGTSAVASGSGGRSRRRRKRKGSGSRAGIGTAGTAATSGSEYLAGSEYTSEAPGYGYGYGFNGGKAAEAYSSHGGSRPDTGLNSLGYLRESGRSEDGYEDEEDEEFDGESREGSIKMEFDFDAIEDEDSPYPEVRASVSNIDDPDMPAMTIRMWVVGLLLCMCSSALNVFFNFRAPAPSIIPLVLVLLSYPIGKLLAFTLPITTYRIPLPYIPSRFVPSSLPAFMHRILRPVTYPHAIEFSLNPGPWNIKEHVLVYIMANVAVGSPYALNAIVVLEVFYEFKTGYWFSLVLVLATQLTGFGLAGMCRRFLVWPASMVWPQNLVVCTLLNTLHAEDEDDGIGMLGGPSVEHDPDAEGGRRTKRGMSRYRFFVWATAASFFFFFIPGFLFEALSVFSFVCWIAPNNTVVNQLFGVRSGLGMSLLTFDWSQIAWIGSPMMIPWWAEVHVFAGFVLFYWILTPILYYTNAWQLAYFPISDTSPYDRFGNRYNVGRVLKTDDTFDEEAYNAYSPLFLPATYAMTYLLAFCLSTCVIVHTLLYHGHTLLNGFKKIRVENDDIHAKLMRNYPEVPDWWYMTAFGVFFSLAIVAVEVWDTSVPIWALVLSVLLPVIYILPSGFIYAMTAQGINLNILAQIIPGSLLPGRPLANMVFKAYSVQTLSEATNFIQDLKLGHYIKVPPRATFLVQMIATCLAGFVQVAVKHWIFTNVKDICQADQPSSLTCPHNQVFFTASAIWGLIGPTRQFGRGSIYHPHLYAIIIGVFLPIPFWLWRRRYPNSWVKWVSTPVVLNGVSWIPPATGINYSSWFAVGFLFQYVIRKRNFAWWSKFNYVLSSALDSGTVIAVIFIFLTLQFPGVSLDWWGNTVHTKTADWEKKPYLSIPEGGIPWKN